MSQQPPKERKRFEMFFLMACIISPKEKPQRIFLYYDNYLCMLLTLDLSTNSYFFDHSFQAMTYWFLHGGKMVENLVPLEEPTLLWLCKFCTSFFLI